MRASLRAVLATLVAALAIVLIAERRYRGASLPTEPPRATLARVLGDGAPHPTGTRELAAVRGRIADVLRELGLPPEERVALACGRYGTCARVHQLVSRVPGRDSTGSVLLVAHADSVGAGPGASDDGAGVAALLEVARAIRGASPRNDVLLAVLEGEELGLLGAEAFVRTDPHAGDVRVVINLEARGTRGPASLFQTSRAGGAWVALATRGLARPVGSSLFATVYERMPNDTDLTVFLKHGKAGLNFAFSGGVEGYHTPLDDLAHQDPHSLAHLTESAMAAVRATADADLRAVPSREDVWFDVLGLSLVRWPAPWSLPLSIVGLLGVALGVVRTRSRVRELVTAFAGWVGALLLTALLGAGITAAAYAAARLPAPWIARPAPILVALFGAPVLVGLSMVALARRAIGMEAMALAVWIAHGLMAAVLSAALPGASYLLVVPTLVAGVAAPFLSTRARGAAIAAPALAGLLVWMVVLRSLYPGLGLVIAPALPVAFALVALPFLPLFAPLFEASDGARRWSPRLALAVVVAATALACAVKPFSRDVPLRVNVLHAQEANATRGVVAADTTWFGASSGDVPREMRAALGAGAEARDGAPVPWHASAAPFRDVAAIDLPAPEVVVLDRDGGSVRLRVTSPRGAPTLLLLSPPASGLLHVDVEGAVSPPSFFLRGLAPGWRGLRLDGVADGVVLRCTFAGAPGEIVVADASAVLPGPATAIAAARPPDAVASQDGDRTIAWRRVRP
ncbi:MAG: M28 family peptidase [Deltaproteobacteria bacterium]|nr:M28 family peptidase [Deltaproteobacteria bacterium]